MDNTALKKHPQPTAAPSQQSTRDHRRRNPSAEPHRFPKVGPEKPAVAPEHQQRKKRRGSGESPPEDRAGGREPAREEPRGSWPAPRPRGFPRVRLGRTAVAPSGQLAKNRRDS